MAIKHRSIGERFRRAKSLEARREMLSDWVDNWERDQRDALDLLNAGIESDETELLTSAAGQMRAIIDKRFPALQRILDAMLDQEASRRSVP